MAKEESREVPHVSLHQQRSESVDKDKQRKELDRRVKNLRMDMAITFSPPEGKRVLRWLLLECGFHKTCVGGNPSLGMDVKDGTLYNAARESIYLELRQLIPSEILKEVEYENIDETLL